MPGPHDQLALVWWDGPGTRIDRKAAADIPILALCAGGSDALAQALDAGADHALSLPITADLLRAVCAAFVRRHGAPADTPALPAAPPPTSSVIDLDRRARTLRVNGEPVHLTLREFDLLHYLVENPGAACSRDELLENVWDIDFETGTNTVDVFIYALRRKLRASGLPRAVETVRGVGYRLAPHLV
jgi:DNA-binding response OmpR family regulator